jgi:hypothetical protein
MQTSLLQWLANVGWTAFTWSLGGLLLLNVGAAAFMLTRGSRDVVQRFTGLWLAANLLLLAVGVGVPAITAIARLTLLAVRAVVPEIAIGD